MSDKGDKESSFFNRWSDRKTAERDGQSLEQVVIPEQSAVAVPSEQEINSDKDFAVPDDLPDIKTLDKDSDYSLFMRDDTPKKLKRLALRKLFSSDPIFAGLDGLNDYDEDFSMVGMVAEAVSTRYKPGEGMISPDKEVASLEDNDGEVAEKITDDTGDGQKDVVEESFDQNRDKKLSDDTGGEQKGVVEESLDQGGGEEFSKSLVENDDLEELTDENRDEGLIG